MAIPSGNFVSQALQRRVQIAGANPLLTWYDADGGARVELSAKTTANWVDKSANLFTSLDIEPNPRVALSLLATHPLHWSTIIWALAAWQAGGSVLLGDSSSASQAAVDVAVVGPTNPHPVPGVATIACSLHPLGMGFAQRPSGVTDAAEALSEPDVHWAQLPADEASIFFQQDDGTGINTDINWGDAVAIEAMGDRILLTSQQVTPDRWDYLATIISALVGGGSVVLVDGQADQQRRAEIADQEKITI